MASKVRGMLTRKELEQAVDRGGIDTVLTVFPDLQGRLMGKRVTGGFFCEEVAEAMYGCNYLVAMDVDNEPVPGYRYTSWEKGYADFVARPDFSTLRRIPWLERTALVICDLFHESGEPVEESPRRILQRQVERAAAAGYVPMLGAELEFYLFSQSYEDIHAGAFTELRPASTYVEDYHILQTTKDEWIVGQIRRGIDAAGIPVEFSKGEWGRGQHEINLRYAAAVEMADRHAVYKNGAKEIAAENGVAVTFMAKWCEEEAGSSCHVHSSLWSPDGRALFHEDGAEPLGISPLFRAYLGGQVRYAPDVAYLMAPYVNSYKRYTEGSFAPTRLAVSHDNRTSGFRLCGGGSSLRVESRIPGADANPYLAFAGVIAAGLAGIEEGLDFGDLFRGDAYSHAELERVPNTLRDALDVFERSDMARAAFGDDVHFHLLHTGRTEQAAFDKAVTSWELRRNFERI